MRIDGQRVLLDVLSKDLKYKVCTMKMKILLADSDISLFSVLEKMLEANSYKVIKAVNGDQTMQLFTAETPDLVLLELMGPDMNGKDVLYQIREMDMCTPVIVLLPAKNECKQFVINAYEAGATWHYLKPIDSDTLLAMINRTLSNGKKSRCFLHNGHQYRLENNRLEKGNLVAFLTENETLLLETLLAYKNSNVTYEFIMRKIWGFSDARNKKTLLNIISQMKKKMQFFPELAIKNTYGKGYTLTINNKSVKSQS